MITNNILYLKILALLWAIKYRFL